MDIKIQEIKKEFKEYVLIFEHGSFYNVYYSDSYVLNELLGFKIKEVKSVKICGFPKTSINRVRSIIEKNNINYIIFDKNLCYRENNIHKNKKNKYMMHYERAIKKAMLEKRLEIIKESVIENFENDKYINLVKKCEDYILGLKNKSTI